VGANVTRNIQVRTFIDRNGVSWQVWRVTPSVRLDGSSPPGAYLPEEAASGWLAFETPAGERRRFYAPPDDWEDLTDAELGVLCHHAVRVTLRTESP
jgi:hypothetical protein